jgi:cell division protease FtsH
VDEEVRLIMEECYNEAKAILSENMEAMDLIADYLIREETITGKEFMELYRQAKGIPEPEESEDSAESAIESERKEIAKIEAMPSSIPEIKAEAEARAEEKAEEAPAPKIAKVPETPAPKIARAPETAKAAPEEDAEEEEAEEKPAKSGPRGRFTDVPQEDVDRFFKK